MGLALAFCLNMFAFVQVDVYSFGVILWEIAAQVPAQRGALHALKVS